MPSPSPAGRAAPTTSRALVVASVLALLGALLVARQSARAAARPCWGDIVPDANAPSPSELAQLPKAPSVGQRLRPGVAALGDFELHFVPVYHRFGDTDEIGWKDLRIVDPSSCSERPIPLNRVASGAAVDYAITISRDKAHDVYVVHGSREVLAAFRKRQAPGLKYTWTDGVLSALVFDALSGVTLLAGLVRAARAAPGEALLGISLLLSALGAVLALGA